MSHPLSSGSRTRRDRPRTDRQRQFRGCHPHRRGGVVEGTRSRSDLLSAGVRHPAPDSRDSGHDPRVPAAEAHQRTSRHRTQPAVPMRKRPEVEAMLCSQGVASRSSGLHGVEVCTTRRPLPQTNLASVTCAAARRSGRKPRAASAASRPDGVAGRVRDRRSGWGSERGRDESRQGPPKIVPVWPSPPRRFDPVNGF